MELDSPAETAELAADDLWGRGATAVELRGTGATIILAASFPSSAAAATVAGEVGGRLVEVDPSWADSEEVDVGGLGQGLRGPGLGIRIDPGRCFGSGSHASTRLLLGLLAAEPPTGRVADIGAGSGILTVAAASLGAAHVQAVDIDPLSAEAVRGNASRNGVADRIQARTGSAADVHGPVDLALVNVTAAVHVALAADVVACVTPGGRILVAGLLPGQWRHVAAAYTGCSVVDRPELDGWDGAVLSRS